MSEKVLMPVRLALRHEGEFWNAYMAKSGTMDDALLLGSIRITFVVNNLELKDRFRRLMQSCMDDLIEETTGARPSHWSEPERAPESDRSGHG